MLSIVGSAAFAQITVKGQLVDAETGEPLIGATVVVEGTSQGTVTNIDGYFTQSVEPNATLLIRYVGYKDLKRKITGNAPNVDLGVLQMQPDAVMLQDVVVTSSIAIARKTPVAMSTVDPVYIEEKLGTQEFPEILKATPGVYANKQGGGYGDSELYMRGFEQDNIAVMINGVPVNDMEWGGIYWSNWDGLRDVARSVQTQRGLGASKVSAPSVGGTVNIVTRGIDAEKGGFISYGMGNDGMNKVLFSTSTGVSKSGWAMNMLLGRSWGDGYVQGAEYEAYNYYLQISKRVNAYHQLSFMVFGAPQKHNQRSSSDGLTLEGWQTAETVYGISGYRYNPSFGYRSNGQATTGSSYNVYHKPQIFLNHQWQIDHKSSLSTAVYASIGRGYGYSGQANDDFSSYSYRDWYGASYGTLNTTFRKADGTFDYAAIEQINAESEYGSLLAMSKSKNYHNWFGLLSTYTTKFGENIDFYGGIDFRYYKGTHTNELVDLYGGEYYMDPSRGDVLAANNANADTSSANYQNWRYEKLGVGDVVYRDYDGYIVQEGVFFQAEYNKDKLAAFLAGSVSNTTNWRYDRYYYDEAHARSKNVNFVGFTAKGGANYNLTDQHNVFVNLGYISRAPRFSGGAFYTSTTSNAINRDAKNEKVFSVEVGYGWRNRWMQLNLNAYYTRWMDKTMSRSSTLNNADQTEYRMNMSGVDALHKGVELDMKIYPTHWLELTGMLSLGDWKWDSNAIGYAYDEYGNALTTDGTITTPGAEDHAWARLNLKGIKVGGAAQTTAAAGANINISKEIRLGLDWNYEGNKYAYYSFSGSNLSLGNEVAILAPWKVPAGYTFDLNASYKFKFGNLNAVVSGNINNLFDYRYISKAYNPNTTVTTTYQEATADNVYVFYNIGRTYSVRLRVNF